MQISGKTQRGIVMFSKNCQWNAPYQTVLPEKIKFVLLMVANELVRATSFPLLVKGKLLFFQIFKLYAPSLSAVGTKKSIACPFHLLATHCHMDAVIDPESLCNKLPAMGSEERAACPFHLLATHYHKDAVIGWTFTLYTLVKYKQA
eukprot:536445-Pelagomonas_calceolata.AAC.8